MQYDGRPPGAHGGARDVRRSSTSRTWARSKPRAPARSRCCSGCSPTTSPQIPIGGAQYSVLCREDGGVLDDLFTYRLDADRYLTVTNAANHERDLAWFRAHAEGFAGRRGDRPDRRLRDARRPGPARARARAGDLRRAAARADDRRHAAPGGRRGARLRHRLHRRGRRRAAARPADAPALWDELVRRGAVPAGLGRARHAAPGGLLPPLRQRPVDRARPDRSGARLVLQGGHRLHRRRGRARGARSRARARSSSRSRSRARDRAPGQPGRSAAARSPAARSRRASGSASAWPTSPPRSAASARAWRSTFVARSARLSSSEKPLYRKGA